MSSVCSKLLEKESISLAESDATDTSALIEGGWHTCREGSIHVWGLAAEQSSN